MADSYVQGSFTFSCTHAELALIEEAFEASYAFMAEDTPKDPSPEFLAAFPPVNSGDLWNGFLAIFPDPDFPDFGVEFEAENPRDRPELSTVCLYSTTDFQPDALAQLIRHCCQETLRQAPIGFEWACSCSRPKVGEFGGGACAIFADGMVFKTTGAVLNDMLSRKSHAATAAESRNGWSEDPEYPVADWQAEVADGGTRLGYWAWVALDRA
ncbi:hypothetical protein [Novosphingobium malaysiense]|uniref:Uncharacterized protein n=1 Tax=Novosphingobium malaysiense TaxID=1348853 RepID=A0A0B1ZM00_9SPHN|nr:hypothetical protein [Novosphingobium malaysiense]KHK90369.1 hypothetical protein LK12_17390 [Novosphingobium malaysiense]